MQRNVTVNALVLRTRRIGDYHKGISCLTPQFGLIDALVYGAYKGKGKISGITEPFSQLNFHLYYNPVKKTYKVVDAEEKALFPAIRNDLPRFYRASLFSEIVLKSYGGGGDSKDIFLLLRDALTLLDRCSTVRVECTVIQFLWRFLILSGMNPELNYCGRCGRQVGFDELLVFSQEENIFVCNQCGASGTFTLNGGERKYLAYTSRQTFEGAVTTGLVKSSVYPLRQLLLTMIQNFLEYPLNSLKNNLL